MTIKELITSPARRLLPFLGAAALLTGCLKENRDGCPTDCLLTVRAYDASGAELTPSDVTSVHLYVFDANQIFVGSHRAQVGQSIRLETRPGRQLHIVAWGNLNGNCTPTIGTDAGGSYVGVRSHTRADYVISPDDVFHGAITINGSDRVEQAEVSISRKVGSMVVTVQNLKEFAGFADDDYSIGIRETYSNIMFDGSLSGDKVSYNPAGSFVTESGRERYYVPAFNLIPEENGVHIDFYHGADLLFTLSQDNDGNPITVSEGMLTNVYCNLSGTLNVSVSMTPWNDEQYWKEF